MRKLISILGLVLLLYIASKSSNVKFSQIFQNLVPKTQAPKQYALKEQNFVIEESTITKVVEKALPSVVTIGIHKTTSTSDSYSIDPFNPFGGYRKIPGKQSTLDQNIGSGFIVSADGLIITNKHVVADTNATYNVLTNDKKKYDVEKIYRDPLNDLAIIKITPATGTELTPLVLGDSTKLKLGQTAIAIGTPLGEFTNTVTTGIVSGLGRGITAGSPLEGYVEKLDNVIQTDAAINPGNSGGPLLSSAGQVIGINTAVAQEGQNIGFAIPVNTIKELVDSFNKRGGSFERPYIGVRYRMIDTKTAVLNELAEGAYVIEVVDGSPAAKAGIEVEDIILEIDGTRIKGDDDQALAKLINDKKVGDTVKLKVWRNKETKEMNVTLDASP